MEVHPDETLSQFEERVRRYSTSDDPIRDFKGDGFLKGTPDQRQRFMVNFDRLIDDEASRLHSPTKDFAKWIALRREFSDVDKLLRKAGR